MPLYIGRILFQQQPNGLSGLKEGGPMTEKGKKKGGKEVYVMTSEAGIHWNRRSASNEAGQVLLIVTLAIVVLIGSLALAADVGFWRYMRRNMQKAADAGAIAGATETIHNPSLIEFAARADASKNGFTHGEDNVIVTVNNPPETGPLTSPHGIPYKDRDDSNRYVEVIIQQPQPTFFAKIFGRTSQMVGARAVAYGGETSGDSCVYALNPTQRESFKVGGRASVHADCDVCISSNDSEALTVGGGPPNDPTQLIADGISVRGGYQLNGANPILEPTPDPDGNGPLCADPLVGLKPPDFSGLPCIYLPNISDNTTLNPGRYCGGITVNNATVKFNPGLYILDGGGLHGTGTLIGDGVTFYNYGTGAATDGDISINGNAGTNLKAGATGYTDAGGKEMYAGILFFQDPKNTKAAYFNGNADTTMLGMLYFPSADAVFDGQNDTTAGYTSIIADTVKFTGGATFSINNESGGSSNVPVPKIVLVE
jgi:hypothetical protein